jgi:hypothetical protein
MNKLLLTIVVLAACSTHSEFNTTPTHDLAGTWTLNRAASDSVKGSRDRDLGRRTGMYLDAFGRPQPGSDYDLVAAIRDSWTTNDDHVQVVIMPNQVRITYSDSAQLRIPTNGEKHLQLFRKFERMRSEARWTPDGLKITHDFDRARVIETWSRPAGANRLTVQTRITSGLPPIEFTRFYEMGS